MITAANINAPNMVHLAIQEGGFQIRPKNLTMDRIYFFVKKFYKLEGDVMKTRTRKWNIVKPRQICMYLMCDYHKLREIGAYFGGIDHTTVIHSRRTVTALMNQDAAYRSEVRQIKSNINSGVNEFFMQTIKNNNIV